MFDELHCNTLDEDLHTLDVEICSFESVLQTSGWQVVGSNPISHVGFVSPYWLLPRAGGAMGPVGRLGPHSRASSTLWMCL